MDLKLIPEEKLIREYNYGRTLTKKGVVSKDNTQKTLYVTDKRVVNMANGHGHTERKDILLKNIENIDLSYAYSASIFALIICLLIGVAAVVLTAMLNAPVVGIVILLLLALVGVVKYFLSRTAALQFYVSGVEGANFQIIDSATSDSKSGTGIFGRAKRSNVKRVKIAVNKDIAETMVYELSALIYEVKGI